MVGAAPLTPPAQRHHHTAAPSRKRTHGPRKPPTNSPRRPRTAQIGWASTPNALRVEPIEASPPKSPQLAVPASAASRVVPGIGGQDGAAAEEAAVSDAAADVEAGMEEILPLAARTALLDYKPGDVAIAATGRGWHVVKVRAACCVCVCASWNV